MLLWLSNDEAVLQLRSVTVASVTEFSFAGVLLHAHKAMDMRLPVYKICIDITYLNRTEKGYY